MTRIDAPPAREARARPLGAVALTALLTGLLVLGGIVAFLPRILGATPHVVDGHTMEPSLSRGDLAVVRCIRHAN